MWPFRYNKSDNRLEQIKQLSALQAQVNYLNSAITFQQSIQYVNDSLALYPNMDTAGQVNQYLTSDHVYSVVNKIAETASLIPFYTYYKTEDKKAANKYITATNRQFYTSKALFDIRLLQIKALEEAPDTDPLEMLLDNPNPYQSKQDFFLALYTYILLNGESFIYKLRLDAGNNKGKPYQLHLLAPENVIILVTKQYPYTITGYQFIINGQTIYDKIPVEDVIHLKKFNPSCDVFGSALRGLSPLKAACKLLSRLSSADTASLKQLQNGGTPGILFDKTIENSEVDQSNIDEARRHFYKFITSPDNTGVPYFSAGEKGFIQTGLKLADLEVAALQKIDFKRLCNIYKISDIVFNNDSASTESNVEEMVKQMITNACLPMAYMVRDKLNKGLNYDFTDKKNRYLDIDLSGITELQEDYKAMADTFSALPGGYTFNELREMFGWDKSDDPIMDKVVVKQGYSFIDDMTTEPIDPNLAAAEYGQTG